MINTISQWQQVLCQIFINFTNLCIWYLITCPFVCWCSREYSQCDGHWRTEPLTLQALEHRPRLLAGRHPEPEQRWTASLLLMWFTCSCKCLVHSSGFQFFMSSLSTISGLTCISFVVFIGSPTWPMSLRMLSIESGTYIKTLRSSARGHLSLYWGKCPSYCIHLLPR